jgi:hypothetical protein
MKVSRSYKEMRRAEVRTVGWFFATMAIVFVVFAAIVAGHYVLGWW